MSKTSTKAKLNLASAKLSLLVLAASLAIVVVECKPTSVRIIKIREPEDPLMALPSSDQAQYGIHSQPQQEIHYVIQPANDAASEPQEAPQYQPAADGSPKQEVHYVYKTEHQFETTPDQVYAPEGNNNQQKGSEYVTLPEGLNKANGNAESARDYPGEIVYVGQNGDAYSDAQAFAQNQTASKVENILTQQAAGMRATILTEVPVRDLPYDVLETLKKEYGVRVVATREHPGANLVINCDEQSAHDSSICAKPQPNESPNSELIYVTGEVEHAPEAEHAPEPEHVLEGQYPAPGRPEESATYEPESVEPPKGTYTTRDGHIRVAGATHTAERQYEPRQEFGTRHQANEEQGGNTSNDGEYTHHTQEEQAQSDRTEAQPETDDHHQANYEQPTQSSGTEDETGKQGEHNITQ